MDYKDETIEYILKENIKIRKKNKIVDFLLKLEDELNIKEPITKSLRDNGNQITSFFYIDEINITASISINKILNIDIYRIGITVYAEEYDTEILSIISKDLTKDYKTLINLIKSLLNDENAKYIIEQHKNSHIKNHKLYKDIDLTINKDKLIKIY